MSAKHPPARKRPRTDEPHIKCPGKPLATRSGRELFPVVFVDFTARSGVRCRPEDIPPEPGNRGYDQRIRKPHLEKEAYVFNPDQAVQAAAQWGSAGKQTEGMPWLKSWYFPTDAFDPWPSKTDLRCWWCTHQFTWSPFPLPNRYDDRDKRYDVTGIFCGPSCAKAYAAGKYPNITHVYHWIEVIAHEFYGYTTNTGATPHIPVAPPRELLRDFCGPKGFTIQQFRSACVHGRSLVLLRPGWITLKQIVEAEDSNARISTKVELAKEASASIKQSAFHPENPDAIQTTGSLVRITRVPFAGVGARRLDEFFGKKQLS